MIPVPSTPAIESTEDRDFKKATNVGDKVNAIIIKGPLKDMAHTHRSGVVGFVVRKGWTRIYFGDESVSEPVGFLRALFGDYASFSYRAIGKRFDILPEGNQTECAWYV